MTPIAGLEVDILSSDRSALASAGLTRFANSVLMVTAGFDIAD
jgi:hypothetical protein